MPWLHRFRLRPILLTLCLTLAALNAGAPAYAQAAPAGQPPDGRGTYDEFVTLFHEFLEWRRPPLASGLPDYRPTIVEQRRADIRGYQKRLDNMGVARWDRARQVDYLAARAVIDEEDFVLHITTPWATDPVFYTDELLQLAFTELPVSGAERDALRERLRAVPAFLRQATTQLTDVAADNADLALFNLTTSDGVGHGHPQRPVPPAGLIGWYEDLLARAKQTQPELAGEIDGALVAVRTFHGWLRENRPNMTAPNGVGKDALDWFLKHAKMIPYSSDEILVLAQRELERTWAYTALEEHRNRKLSPLTLASSREDYHRRLAETDAMIRRFLVEEEFISIPDHIPADWQEMGFNVPFVDRGTPPNFWEQVQYRDPSPDHLHAVIPGHRFDTRIEQRNPHPIRGRISFGDRREGWAVYLEEAALLAGLFEDRPRTRELIYVFGLWRAARTIGDVRNQRNELTAPETIQYWMHWTPFLDENVSRRYAYLRATPGHGLHYTIGAVQVYKLLAERRHQLGSAFVLKEFHDDFMSRGRLPVALIRYEMTGYDDQVREFWNRTPVSTLKRQGGIR